MPTGTIATTPKFQFLDGNGNPLAGGTLTTYLAGTTTPETTWQDQALSTANTNPITLDSRGECVLWLDSAKQYKFLLKNSAGVTQWTQDNISGAGSLANTLRVDLAASSGAALVGYLPAGVGAVATTVQGKLREKRSVKDFGAVGDGVADDTAAIQAALTAALAGSDLEFPGTYIISSPLTGTLLSSVHLFGNGTLKAAAGTDFEFLLDITGTSDVTVSFLTFDANKANRGAAAGGLGCLKVNATTRCTLRGGVYKNALGPSGGGSFVAIAASGTCTGLLAVGLRFLDLGTNANTRACDGIFVRGNYCLVTDCYAENVTDHAFVLEGCNYSVISNSTAKDCTSIGAISNDTSIDVRGNMLCNLTILNSHVGSFGGSVGLYTFGTGLLIGAIIDNINIVVSNTAAGAGAPVYVAGRVAGARLSNISVDAGTTIGKVTHGITIDTVANADTVSIKNCSLKNETGVGTGVRILNASSGINIEGSRFDSAAVGIYADGTSTFIEDNNTYPNCTAKIGLAGTASYSGSQRQTWTPIYSSDIGDAAATFTATPTTTKARISRIGTTVSIELAFIGTLRAVTPNYISLTLPAWATAIDSNSYTPANVLNDVTYETGTIRPIAGTTVRIYRANFVNFSVNAGVSGRVNFSFEVA